MEDARTLQALIRVLKTQTETLVFDQFNEATAWQLGNLLHQTASNANMPIVIDIRFFHCPLFFASLPGASPENVGWARRKRNVVEYTHKPSYLVGRELALKETSLPRRYGLPEADYAAHGGSFPLTLKGSGVLGAMTVSGLAQREDHQLVAQALCQILNKDPAPFALPPA